MPFRLYERSGKFKVSYGYKLPNGKWEFRLTAPASDAEAVARVRTEAIERANVLNGAAPTSGPTEDLFQKYFAWQKGLPADSEDRKAASTLSENEIESKRLIKVFGKVKPSVIKPVHVYKYLAGRAQEGAPAKANKEIALLSAVLEYGRRLGELETNPCRGIKYNKTRPRQKYVEEADINMMMRVARERGGSYLILALCLQVAYLTVSRPEEMRQLMRQAVKDGGIEVAVGKRKKGHAVKHKLIEWSPALHATVQEALSLQRTTSLYVFGNTAGQPYTRSGFNTILGRLMKYCAQQAAEDGGTFNRFTLADMRPTAVTDRMEEGDTKITDATGHSDGRMVAKVYDRRRIKTAKATK
ncbi:MAG TPA: tyrosine-type recombinase/integrase [Noviherbaspirillum sp.]|uniref:tyrosine-type recombinase/integrase n=1 Tax=Noviherbaspirillum sp. TaxID=1926288 RepID=UPI002F9315F9